MRNSYHPNYKQNKSRKRNRRFIIIVILLALFSAGAWIAWTALYSSNVYIASNKPTYIDVPTGSTFDDVKKSLYSSGIIVNRATFEAVAKLKKLDQSIKPGRYNINPTMNNLQLVNKLRAGMQDPVKVIFNNVRYTDQLAGKISAQIEADSLSLVTLMNDKAFLDSLGVNPLSLFTIMIPNTYELYWNTTARAFIKRMKSESESFWNGKRDELAKQNNLTRQQVITLASIVEKETNQNDEKARVAGVYLNRLRKGWLLEADPTLVFAHGNFNIKRVLNIYKEIDSPYNTYKYPGLPPGPICLPSVSSIDAVLNSENHEFMFFCAREDFSGYHSFASTLEQHNNNAHRYQQALNKRNILN